MNDRNRPPELPADEQLVAYLDGELDAASARQIEASLAEDHVLRNRLHELDGTWQLLSQLATDAASRDFTRTTLELVAAADEAAQRSVKSPHRRLGRAAVAVGGLLLSAVFGFLVVAAVRPDPNRQLIEELPILERLEQFRAVGNLEFLAALRQARLFEGNATSEEEDRPYWTDEPAPESARRHIEAMSPTGKEQLRRRQEQFASLPADEQTQLRRFYDDLAAAPDNRALLVVADRYYAWLKSLPPITRAELVELSLKERIEQIKSLLARQATERIERLGPDEAKVLSTWLAGLTDRMIEAMPQNLQERIRQESDPQRRRGALLMSLHTFRSPDAVRRIMDQVFTDADLAKLLDALPEPTRTELKRHPTAQQWHIVRGWMPQLMFHHWPRRGSRGLIPDGEQRGLAEFFETELDDAEFDRLLALPADEMQQELQRLYLQHGKGGPPPGFRYPGPPGRRMRPGPFPREGQEMPSPPDDASPPPPDRNSPPPPDARMTPHDRHR